MAEELQIWSQRLNSKFVKKSHLKSRLSQIDPIIVYKEEEVIDVAQTLK